MIQDYVLVGALDALRQGVVLVGNPAVAGGMLPLGYTKGRPSFTPTYEENNTTADNLTGPLAHQTMIKLVGAEISCPVIITDEALYEKLNPVAPAAGGQFGGGWSKPQPARTTTVLLVPQKEFDANGQLSYDGATWAPAAPKHAIWLWRARRIPSDWGLGEDNGGESGITLTFKGMFDATKPEGHKVFTVGNPVLAGYGALRL